MERLHEEAVRRSVSGTERPVFRRGRRVEWIRDYDSGLLQFLLRMHWPQTYARDRPADSLVIDVWRRFRNTGK